MLEGQNAAAVADSAKTAVETPEQNTPAPKPEAKKKPDLTPEQQLDADLGDIFDKHNPSEDDEPKAKKTRKADGAVKGPQDKPGQAADAEDVKPAAEEKKPAKAEAKTDDSEAKAEDEVKSQSEPRRKAPVSWSKAMKEKFSGLPEDVQEYVAQRDGDANTQIANLGRVVKQLEPFGTVLKEHERYIAAQGKSAPDFINNILRGAQFMDQNPREFLKQFAKHSNIDLVDLIDDFDAHSTAPSPEVAELRQQVQQLQSTLNAQVHDRRQAAEKERASHVQSLEQRIAEFTADNPDVEDVWDDFAVHLQVNNSRNMPIEKAIQAAYETAIWGNPQTRQAQLDRQMKEQEAARVQQATQHATAAKTAASINVDGDLHANEPQSLDDTLRAIARKHNLR